MQYTRPHCNSDLMFASNIVAIIMVWMCNDGQEVERCQRMTLREQETIFLSVTIWQFIRTMNDIWVIFKLSTNVYMWERERDVYGGDFEYDNGYRLRLLWILHSGLKLVIS